MKDFEIEIYRTADGKSQLDDFVNKMDIKTRAKYISYVELLEQRGSFLRMPYSKCLEEGIFELRIDVFGKFTRILYFFIKGRRIILTNGFIKKANKTPPGEIEKAIKYRNDYLERTKYD